MRKADKKGFHKLYLDGIMGLVVGDALGVPVEFTYREELKKSPVVGMMGYGTYPMPEGSWSDDSSMTLATLSALHDGYDLKRIMDNFVAWEQEGVFTPTRILFDEGNTCRMAIRNYMNEGNISTSGLSGENSNGNGSLMRILPICLYSYYLQKECAVADEDAINLVHNVSALTHAHVRSKMACGIYYFCVKAIADRKGNVQECLQTGIDAGFEFYGENRQCSAELKHFSRIRDTETFRQIPDTEIRSGGYVIESIEAAIWCLLTTDNYRDCVLKAVNLGYDTDTTAAIAGGLAGLYYGYDNIPAEWKAAIIRRD